MKRTSLTRIALKLGIMGLFEVTGFVYALNTVEP